MRTCVSDVYYSGQLVHYFNKARYFYKLNVRHNSSLSPLALVWTLATRCLWQVTQTTEDVGRKEQCDLRKLMSPQPRRHILSPTPRAAPFARAYISLCVHAWVGTCVGLVDVQRPTISSPVGRAPGYKWRLTASSAQLEPRLIAGLYRERSLFVSQIDHPKFVITEKQHKTDVSLDFIVLKGFNHLFVVRSEQRLYYVFGRFNSFY